MTPYGWGMNPAAAIRVVRVMRPLLASALFALGCSFALVALRGGDSVIAAVTLVAACSTGAAMIRLLGTGQFVDDVNNARDVARDR
jgi:hypothetical protein